MREAEILARELGDRRRLGRVLADMGARLRNVGDHERALEASRQALDIATELGDPGLEIEAKYRLAQGYFALGDFAQATALFDQTVQALRDESATDRRSVPSFVAAWPRLWLGLTFAHLGRFTEALEHAENALRIAEAAGHPHTVVEAHGALGGVSLERGDLPAALRVFERGVALLRARELGDANLLSGLGYAYALSGRLSEAFPLLEEGVRGEASISAMGLGLAVRISRLAEACLLAGRVDEALERARSAIDLSRTHKERANEAMGLRVLAEVTAGKDRPDTEAAREHYAHGLALAEELGMRPLVAHCHRGLGKLHRRTGRHDQAREHLATAITMFTDMGMAHGLEMARAEVATL
jgi:ATP/maltotriose-dependent transcriptional regulator MalT